MEREILYKAQKADGNVWVVGYPVFGPDKLTCKMFWWESVLTDPVNNGWEIKQAATDVLYGTLCQFTNKTDKDGKNIFEGDEILFSIPNLPVRIKLFVEFIDGGFAVQFKGSELYLSDLQNIELTGRNIND